MDNLNINNQDQNVYKENKDILLKNSIQNTESFYLGIGSNFSWDSYQRKMYMAINTINQKQVNDFVKHMELKEKEGFTNPKILEIIDKEINNFTRSQIDQRNIAVIETRAKTSPFAQLYAEWEKPVSTLKTYDELLTIKGFDKLILKSVGKTRTSVNELSINMTRIGIASIVVSLIISGYLIYTADPRERYRVIAQQLGVAVVGAGIAWLGAGEGCALFMTAASPTLTIPFIGEISEGGACLLGAAYGAYVGGAVGAYAGQDLGNIAYDYVTSSKWIKS